MKIFIKCIYTNCIYIYIVYMKVYFSNMLRIRRVNYSIRYYAARHASCGAHDACRAVDDARMREPRILICGNELN